MWDEDKELEKYLGEFQPRKVRALNQMPMARGLWTRRLAAAAMLAGSVGAGWWFTERGKITPREQVQVKRWRLEVRVENRQANTILLTKMALEDPKRFAQQMDEESRRVLPNLSGPHSTLDVLAKE